MHATFNWTSSEIVCMFQHSLAAFLVVFTVTPVLGNDVLALPELIDAVAQNETHYRNLKIDIASVYGLSHDLQVVPVPPGVIPAFKPSVAQITEISLTVMDDRFRCRQITSSHRVGEAGGSEAIDVFDGRTHRHYWKHWSNDTRTGKQLLADSGGRVANRWPPLTNLARWPAPHFLIHVV